MGIKDFVGKVVVSAQTMQRYTLYRITSSYIDIAAEKANELGYHPHYRYEIMNNDPITEGKLIFGDTSLTEPFIKAFNAYRHTKDAYWEDYGYWMRKD